MDYEKMSRIRDLVFMITIAVLGFISVIILIV
jgi:hypothetical protein